MFGLLGYTCGQTLAGRHEKRDPSTGLRVSQGLVSSRNQVPQAGVQGGATTVRLTLAADLSND
jgi:hypothetical protein